MIGSFNSWTEKVPLIFCQLRNTFVRYIKGLRKGDEYEFKFIVDGSYQLNSMYEINESVYGKGYVNVITCKNGVKGIRSSMSMISFTTYSTE